MKHISLWIGIGIGVALLTGCGGHSDVTTGKQLSVITGSAVSGQAVREVDVKKNVEDDAEHMPQFCNDTHLYYISQEKINDMFDKNVLVQYDLKKGTKKSIDIVHLSHVIYVDNDWVYYTTSLFGKSDSLYDGEQLHRAPLLKNQLQVDKAESMWRGEMDLYHGYYCDGKNLIYRDGKQGYIHYDMEKCAYEVIEPRTKEKDWTGGSLIMTSQGDGYLGFVQGNAAVYRYNIVKHQMVSVTAKPQKWIGDFHVVTPTGGVYADFDNNIWKYSTDGSKEKWITRKQIKALLPEEKEFYNIYGMFIRGNQVYLEVGMSWDEEDNTTIAYVVLTKSLSEDGVLEKDEALNEILKNPCPKAIERETTLTYQFLTRGICLDITEDFCYMLLEHPKTKKNVPAIYEFQSEKLTYLTEKDILWQFPFFDSKFYLGQMVEDAQIACSMPNNNEIEGCEWERIY